MTCLSAPTLYVMALQWCRERASGEHVSLQRVRAQVQWVPSISTGAPMNSTPAPFSSLLYTPFSLAISMACTCDGRLRTGDTADRQVEKTLQPLSSEMPSQALTESNASALLLHFFHEVVSAIHSFGKIFVSLTCFQEFYISDRLPKRQQCGADSSVAARGLRATRIRPLHSH